MKPVLAAAICLMLGSSSFSSPGVAASAPPATFGPVAIHQAVLGHAIPVLTGRGATLALVIVK
jgi:hypothetical protein